jgi:hypothetical protein
VDLETGAGTLAMLLLLCYGMGCLKEPLDAALVTAVSR